MMRISAVTPSFNQAHFLKETAENILGQRGEFELEWIVMDGGSSDGTVELLKSINDPRLTWVSEKDDGQGDAINKGLARATGEIVTWLNCDDLYCEGTLDAVAKGFVANPQKAWLTGLCNMIDVDGKPTREAITAYKNFFLRRYSYRRLLMENFVSQPATFWRKSAATSVDASLYNTNDYDLWLRLGKISDPVVLDRVVSLFRFHYTSKSMLTGRAQFDEQYRVAQRYFGNDHFARIVHRLNVEKIIWAYRALRIFGV